MKKFLLLAASVLLFGASASPVQAFFYCGPLFCAPCVYYQTCVVASYRPEWRAEYVPITVPTVSYRPVYSDVKVQVMVPRWYDAKQAVCSYVPVPREVEQLVTTCNWVPASWTDPCTGCSWTYYQPQPVVNKVKCTVWDWQAVWSEVAVKRCQMVPEERTQRVCNWVPEYGQRQSWTVRWNCVMVPCQTTVCVPYYAANWGW
jgi:hypothetical protein